MTHQMHSSYFQLIYDFWSWRFDPAHVNGGSRSQPATYGHVKIGAQFSIPFAKMESCASTTSWHMKDWHKFCKSCQQLVINPSGKWKLKHQLIVGTTTSSLFQTEGGTYLIPLLDVHAPESFPWLVAKGLCRTPYGRRV